jgi:chitodextrinase
MSDVRRTGVGARMRFLAAMLVATVGLCGCGVSETESGSGSTSSRPLSGSTQDTTPPAAPRVLNGTAVSPSQINLNWSASSDNVAVVGYRLYRNGALLITLGDVIDYQDTSVSASTTYFYRVRAFDGAGNLSGESPAVILTTPAVLDNTAPLPPTVVTANAISSRQINLNWSGATDNVAVTGYRIFRNGEHFATLGNVSSYQDTLALPGTTYVYTIRAVDAAGNVSSLSPAASATTPPAAADTTPPTTPGGLNAIAVSPTQIDLNWLPASDDVVLAGYRVYRNGALVIVLGDSTAYQDTGLTPSTVYSYNVDAYDAAGNASGLSAPANAATFALPDTTAPTAPNGLVAAAISSFQINLSWLAATDDVGVTGYRVFRNGVFLTDLPNVTAYEDIGLAASTTYTYRVRAFDAAGNVSSQSNAASASTPAIPDTTPPTTPSGLAANAVSSSQIELSWSPSTDNVAVTGYRVYQNGVFLAAVGNVTAYQVTGLAGSTSYTYHVDAVDAVGNASGISAPAFATTLASNTATLEWDAVAGAIGYRIYYGTTQGGPYFQSPGNGVNVGNVTSFTVTGLASGTRYFFVATAFDATNESAFSNEVFKDIP